MPRIKDDERNFREAVARGASIDQAGRLPGIRARSVPVFVRRLGLNPIRPKEAKAAEAKAKVEVDAAATKKPAPKPLKE